MPFAQSGHDSGSCVGTSIWTRLKSGTGTCAESPPRSTSAAAPETVAPAAFATSIVSRVDPPVVTTSSTTTTRSAGDSVKPRRSVSFPSDAFGEHRTHAQRATDLLANDDAAQRGRQDRRRLKMPDTLAERFAERAGELGILKDERTLKIPIAVQARRQPEVPFEQRTGPAEQIENGLGIHYVAFPLCGVRKLSSNSFRIRLYSSAQLAASVKP